MVTVLLAAGLSQRMHKPKLLLPLGGKPLFMWALEAALEASEEVILVLGNQANAMIPFLPSDPNLMLIHNMHPYKGQFSSTQLGLTAVNNGSDFALAVADAPLITKHHYDTLAAHLGSFEAVRPHYSGTPGHPVLCKAHLKPLILELDETATMRSFLSYRKVLNLQDHDLAWITDVDTTDQYEQLLSSFAAQ
ncbi:MAG: nucleotidyltransferase family protein [Sphaerochaetaceae bacterium]